MAREYPDQPQLAAAVVVFHRDKVLMVERAAAPSEKEWAIPGGCVELGETLAEAVEREVLEETGVRVRAGKPVHVFDSVVRDREGRVRFHYLIVDLLGEYLGGEPHAGDDALQAAWLSRQDLGRLEVSPASAALLASKFDFTARDTLISRPVK